MCRTDAEGPGALLRGLRLCLHQRRPAPPPRNPPPRKLPPLRNPPPREKPPPERPAPPPRKPPPGRKPPPMGGRGPWGPWRAGPVGPAEDKGPVDIGRGRHAGQQVAPPVAAVAPAVGGAHHDHHQEDQQKQPHLPDHSEHKVILRLRVIDKVAPGLRRDHSPRRCAIIALIPAIHVVEKARVALSYSPAS